MAIVEELIAVLGFDMRGEGDARRYQATIKEIDRSLTSFARTAGFAAAAAATAFAAGAARLGQSVVQTSAQFEGFEVALTTIEGSAEKARQSMDWISEFAIRTPYDVAGITQAFIKLKTFGIDPLANDTLRTLGDTASAMNLPLNQAVEALADAATFQFERLREFGVTASQEGNKVTFQFQKDGQTVTKTVEKTGDAVSKFLLENFGERFGGAMDAQSKTFNGIVSNLQETWVNFQRQIGNAGFFDAVKDKFQEWLDGFNALDDNGTLDAWAKSISDGLTAAFNAGTGLIERLAGHAKFLADNFDKLEGPLKIAGYAFAALMIKAFPLSTVLGLIVVAIEDLLTYMQGGDSMFGRLTESIAEFLGANPEQVAEVLFDIAAGAAGLAVSAGAVATFAGAIRSLAGAFGLLSSTDTSLPDAPSKTSGRKVAPKGSALGGAAIAAAAAYAAGAVLSEAGTTPEQRVARAQEQNNNGWFGRLWQRGPLQDAGDMAWLGGGLWKRFLHKRGFGVEPTQNPHAPVYQPPETPAERQEREERFAPLKGFDIHEPLEKMSVAADRLSTAFEVAAPALENAKSNVDAASVLKAGQAVVNDQRQDNRDQSMQNTITVNQTVTQATDAPRAAADATGSAVGNAAVRQRSSLETEPNF